MTDDGWSWLGSGLSEKLSAGERARKARKQRVTAARSAAERLKIAQGRKLNVYVSPNVRTHVANSWINPLSLAFPHDRMAALTCGKITSAQSVRLEAEQPHLPAMTIEQALPLLALRLDKVARTQRESSTDINTLADDPQAAHYMRDLASTGEHAVRNLYKLPDAVRKLAAQLEADFTYDAAELEFELCRELIGEWPMHATNWQDLLGTWDRLAIEVIMHHSPNHSLPLSAMLQRSDPAPIVDLAQLISKPYGRTQELIDAATQAQDSLKHQNHGS